uniref:Methyltransferase n=1 Tax=viral metagenome TaxID=1070528 RepID=A0A6C0ATD3_9ZZZZ
MKILYGTNEKCIDVTEICCSKLQENSIITIPAGDIIRSEIFTDPDYGNIKHVYVVDNDGIVNAFDESVMVIMDTLQGFMKKIVIDDIGMKLHKIHSNLKCQYGSLTDELSEQRMAVTYLTGKEKVLELGGNIGRNSLVIASILGEENSSNLVTLECDTYIANQLRENRDANRFSFHIENAALSKRNLIQRDWDTIESDILLDGYNPVTTITLDELNAKYNILFDTLVLDCEGAFYYIVMDMPEILNNITLIIMENDYHELSHKEYIDAVLKEKGFYVDYSECGGWGPCEDRFFEVWKR